MDNKYLLKELDLKDRKILYQLDLNARESIAKIGKKVGLSKEVVKYRIQKLEEKGIIKQYTTLIDVGKLGLSSFRIMLKFKETTPAKEEEIIKYLKNIQNILWIGNIQGNWGLSIWICVKKISDFELFWDKFNSIYSSNIEKQKLSIFTNVIYFHREYLIDQGEEIKKRKGETFISIPNKIELTDLDLKILKLISNNARMSTIQIARELKSNVKTIRKHLKTLRKKQVIIGYRTLFNLKKIGLIHYKINIILSEIPKIQKKQIENYVNHHPNSIYKNKILSGWDIEFEIEVNSEEELKKIIYNMKEKFGEYIYTYEITKFLDEYKYVYFPTSI
ncbi:MAG: winged helix-turn-helix transcriptional regulator [Candidatus Micrarchaeia archaeon]|jgi:DNA-binding Lrp family transcriptional regulator